MEYILNFKSNFCVIFNFIRIFLIISVQNLEIGKEKNKLIFIKVDTKVVAMDTLDIQALTIGLVVDLYYVMGVA